MPMALCISPPAIVVTTTPTPARSRPTPPPLSSPPATMRAFAAAAAAVLLPTLVRANRACVRLWSKVGYGKISSGYAGLNMQTTTPSPPHTPAGLAFLNPDRAPGT